MTTAHDTPSAAQAHTPRPRPSGIDLDTAQLAIARAHALIDLLRAVWPECARGDGAVLAGATVDTAFWAALAELEVAAQCLAGEVRP